VIIGSGDWLELVRVAILNGGNANGRKYVQQWSLSKILLWIIAEV